MRPGACARAVVTAADPRWWERNFSQLGVGWAFNGTLVVAGLLVATVGAYIGRDLHRVLGDDALPRIAAIVALWAVAGAAREHVGVLVIGLLISVVLMGVAANWLAAAWLAMSILFYVIIYTTKTKTSIKLLTTFKIFILCII